MAKQDRDDKGKVKFRFIEFEMEGGNSSLQESLRSIAGSLSRANVVASLPPGRSAPNAIRSQPTVEEAAQFELGLEDSTLEETLPTEPAPAKPRSRKIASPHLLDLELLSGPISLKQFCEDKRPDSDMRKYLVIAAWLKEYRGISSVSSDHIHTCYRHMGWRTPKDPAQPLRDMKRKHDWLSKADEPGHYSINHIGENVVREMAD